MDTDQPKLLSVVVPAHNEARGIAHAVDVIVRRPGFLRDWHWRSSSSTTAAATTPSSASGTCRTGTPAIKGLRFTRNFGKEAALLAGLRVASGDAVVTIDSDLQHPPALIPAMIDAVAQRRAWSSTPSSAAATRDGPLTRLRAELFNSLLSRLGGINLENASDFKLLDRIVVDAIAQGLPERQRFYRGLADWVGYRHASVPFDVEARAEGQGQVDAVEAGRSRHDGHRVVHERPAAHRDRPGRR